MNKKRLFAILLFIIFGLFMFTFANPKGDDNENKLDGKTEETPIEVVPEVETNETNEEEIVEPVVEPVVLQPTRNNQNNNFVNVVTPTTPTTDNVPTYEPQEPTEEEPTVEPVKVYYNVKFIGFDGKVLMNEKVLEGSTVETPEVVEEVAINNVVYTFTGWDNENIENNTLVINADTEVNANYEITKITAMIVSTDDEELGSVNLIVEAASEYIGESAVITTVQSEIEDVVDGDLPTTINNHHYDYTELAYDEEVGFVITASVNTEGPVITVANNNDEANTYVVGDTYEEFGATATDNYDENVTVNVDNSEVDTTKEGTYTVTYTATDSDGNTTTTTRTVNVIALALDHLELSSYGKTYFIGNDMENVTVTAVYNNGNRKELTKQVCTEERVKVKEKGKKTKWIIQTTCTGDYVTDSEFTSSIVGTRSIVYSYTDKELNQEASATYTYTVKQPEVIRLELNRYEDTYFYNANNNTRMENIIVTAVYDDGNSKTLNPIVCEDEWSWFEWDYVTTCTGDYETEGTFYTNEVGTRTITYSYEGFDATYTYTVKAPEVKGYELSSNYGVYIVNDEIADDVYVIATYDDGHTENITNYTIEGFDTSFENAGNGRTATIKYNGFEGTYTYDVRYHAELGRVTIGSWYNSHDEYYMTFDFEGHDYVSVENIAIVEGNNTYNVPVELRDGKYIIVAPNAKAYYDKLDSMNGDGSKKLVVTYDVDGEELVSTYTRVIHN